LRLGILGGTFDPVHLGHLILAETAREENSLDRVLFIPTGLPWRKSGRNIAPAEHRLAMLRLAIEGNDSFEISTVEVDRGGPSYTADTLEELGDTYPGADFFFIMGEDSLADLPNWRRPQRIVELATLLVAGRGGAEGPPGSAPPGLEARVEWLRMPLVQISATDIRERVRRGRSVRYFVPAAVEEYIREHGLYGWGKP
jgi:nicotinate-nucleotide adenylyltransferase